MSSEKATKIDKIFTVDLTVCSNCQIDGEDFVKICGLLRKHELYHCVLGTIQTLCNHWTEWVHAMPFLLTISEYIECGSEKAPKPAYVMFEWFLREYLCINNLKCPILLLVLFSIPFNKLPCGFSLKISDHVLENRTIGQFLSILAGSVL